MDQVQPNHRRVLRKVTSLSQQLSVGKRIRDWITLNEPLKHGTRAPVTTRGAILLAHTRPGTSSKPAQAGDHSVEL